MVATGPWRGCCWCRSSSPPAFLRGLQPVSYYAADGSERPGRLLTYEPVWHALDPAFEYIAAHAAPGRHRRDVGAAPGLSAHRPARRPAAARAGSRHGRAISRRRAGRYLVLDELDMPGISERYAAAVWLRHPDAWRLVYTTPGTGVRVYATGPLNERAARSRARPRSPGASGRPCCGAALLSWRTTPATSPRGTTGTWSRPLPATSRSPGMALVASTTSIGCRCRGSMFLGLDRLFGVDMRVTMYFDVLLAWRRWPQVA